MEESTKKEKQRKEQGKNKYIEYLNKNNGDRKLLKQKRKKPIEEFSQKLPYFNMLPKDKKDLNDNNLLLDDDNDENEIYFVNTQKIPVNEILLGDVGIVDHHLNDFKYTPLKLYEMIRDSYGKTKIEAENKCALNCLFVLFKKKFKTFNELHEYFERKNGKYLDILLEETCTNNNINNNNNDNSKYKNNIFSFNFNENLINNGISEINNSGYSSSSNNNSISSKQLVEALSSQDDKINELIQEKFDSSLFYIEEDNKFKSN